MKVVRGIVVAILCLFALSGVARADTLPTLTLDPVGGALTGAPGSTVGWGFTLENLGVNFVEVTSFEFCVGVITSPCNNSSLGTFTDFTPFNFILVGPSSSVTQVFDNTLMTGVGSFLINLGATGSDIGQIVMHYDLYSSDPTLGGTQIAFNNSLTADASVTVETRSVPEPASLLLLASGLAGCLFAKKIRG